MCALNGTMTGAQQMLIDSGTNAHLIMQLNVKMPIQKSTRQSGLTDIKGKELLKTYMTKAGSAGTMVLCSECKSCVLTMHKDLSPNTVIVSLD